MCCVEADLEEVVMPSEAGNTRVAQHPEGGDGRGSSWACAWDCAKSESCDDQHQVCCQAASNDLHAKMCGGCADELSPAEAGVLDHAFR